MPTLKPILSQNPQDKLRMASSMAAMFQYNNLRFESMMPAMVTQYDRETNMATVQPLMYWVDTQDGVHKRGDVTQIPVLSMGAGGFHINFPVKPNDLGWIYASDRDLAQFKATLKISKPHTARNHKFEDGLFIPDVFRQYTINGEDADAMVIQSTDGATRISIRGDNIKITTPTTVTLDSNVHVTKNVSIDGDVTMAKTLVVATEVTVKGVAVTTHGHISSAPGSRTSGGMIA